MIIRTQKKDGFVIIGKGQGINLRNIYEGECRFGVYTHGVLDDGGCEYFLGGYYTEEQAKFVIASILDFYSTNISDRETKWIDMPTAEETKNEWKRLKQENEREEKARREEEERWQKDLCEIKRREQAHKNFSVLRKTPTFRRHKFYSVIYDLENFFTTPEEIEAASDAKLLAVQDVGPITLNYIRCMIKDWREQQ